MSEIKGAISEGLLLGKFEAQVKSYISLPRPEKLKEIRATLEEINKREVPRMSARQSRKLADLVMRFERKLAEQRTR